VLSVVACLDRLYRGTPCSGGLVPLLGWRTNPNYRVQSLSKFQICQLRGTKTPVSVDTAGRNPGAGAFI
jgi:hypothetical protein